MRILTFAPLPWGASPLGWVGVALGAPFPALLPVWPCVGVAPVGGLRWLAGGACVWVSPACRLSPLAPLRLPLGVWGSSRFNSDDDEQAEQSFAGLAQAIFGLSASELSSWFFRANRHNLRLVAERV